MRLNNYTLLSLIFLALSLMMKSIPLLDIEMLKFFNSLMFSEAFFSYFTEIGNGLICQFDAYKSGHGINNAS